MSQSQLLQRSTTSPRWPRGRKTVLVSVASLTLLAPIAQTPAHAQVSAVSGGAFGWKSTVSLFGGPSATYGTSADDAVVDLLSTGSGGVPVIDQAVFGTGAYGPAVIYKSVGPILVTTNGELGDSQEPGHVESSSTVTNVGTWIGVKADDAGAYVPELEGHMDPFIALEVSSTCSTTENGTPTGTTTIREGRTVETRADGTYFNSTVVSENPLPNTSWGGRLRHISPPDGDEWRITFNEQIVSGGNITVNAVHLELLGPIAQGHLYIGQSRCGYTP